MLYNFLIIIIIYINQEKQSIFLRSGCQVSKSIWLKCYFLCKKSDSNLEKHANRLIVEQLLRVSFFCCFYASGLVRNRRSDARTWTGVLSSRLQALNFPGGWFLPLRESKHTAARGCPILLSAPRGELCARPANHVLWSRTQDRRSRRTDKAQRRITTFMQTQIHCAITSTISPFMLVRG